MEAIMVKINGNWFVSRSTIAGIVSVFGVSAAVEFMVGKMEVSE